MIEDRARYASWVERVAEAIHEDCRLEWQAIAVVDAGRAVRQHLADVHYGIAHNLVRRLALAEPRTIHLVVRAGCDDVMAVHSTAVEAYADREMRERGRAPGAYRVESWGVLDAEPSYAELQAEGATR